MLPPRHLRLRVLEALEDRVKQFRTREGIYPLRIPRDPIPLDDLITRALADDAESFDAATLKSRTLLTLGWDGVTWATWVITLPSGVKLFCDSDEEETRVLASGGRNAGDESDRLFLTLLAESRGEHFGIELGGGAPTSVRSPLDRELLVAVFVDLFESTEAEESICQSAAAAGGLALERELREGQGRDFAVEVRLWLDEVMGARMRENGTGPRPAP